MDLWLGTVTTNLDQGRFNWPLNNALVSVTLPNGRAWGFNAAGMSANPGLGYICPQETQTVTVTHPYGTVGTYTIWERRHRQSLNEQDQIRNSCPNEDIGGGDPNFNPYRMRVARIMSTTKKILAAPNLPSMTWNYQYESDPGPINTSASDRTNWTTVLDPNGHETKYYHNWTREPLGGKLMKKEVRSAPGASVLETTTLSYVQEGAYGTPVAQTAHTVTSFQSTYEASSTTNREGYDITVQSTYDTNPSSTNYSFGQPLSIVRGSTLGGNRTETRTYLHNKTKWILGRLLTSTVSGRLYDSYTYDANGRVSQQSKYGTLAQTYTYHTVAGSIGALATATNALNQVTQFNNWKRGTPQQIIRADSTSIGRVIDDNGWVTSQTDAKGTTTGFQYNPAGWLTVIDAPAPWADTSIAYVGFGTNYAYAQATTGSSETVVWYDEFLRPFRVRSRAASGGGETSHVKTSYDGLGRTIFTSLPSAGADPTQGMQFTFDALGRPLTATDNITGGVTTTAYLTSGQTRVTNPKGDQTVTTQRFFGSPDAAETISVAQPLGLTSSFQYDTYGNMTLLTQAGSQNGYTSNISRNFWYDARNRLCRHRAPELGDELFGYDALDRLTQKASGLSAGTDCAAPPNSERTVTTFDAMSRPTLIDFPGATPDITKAYDNNGNTTSVTRAGSVWTYQHNTMDAPTLERLQIDGRTYEFTYGYTPEGFLSTGTMPYAGAISFSPNGLGQSTGIIAGGTTFASGATYFVNGEMSGLALGNGFSYSATQNARQLVTGVQTVSGGANAVAQAYTYDPVLPRLTGIIDNAVAGENRGFGYDALGRLTIADGPWGAGSFKYDALGNMRQQVLGPRTIDVDYNATNRVSQFKDSSVGSTWKPVAHDARGNVTTKDNLGFVYDYANQPTGLTGSVTGAYTYDGNLKRVKSVVGGTTIYNVYSSVTGRISVVDNVTSTEAFSLLNLGPVSVRRKSDGSAEYTHLNHLGSPIASTNTGGVVLWRESYNPFGGKRVDPVANRDKPGFTGHIDDSATGLTYMQARYYDPVLGRFLSTDPIGYQDQLNLYAYVANDPINRIDPTGLAHLEIPIDGKFVPGIGFGGRAAITLAFPLPSQNDRTPFDLGFAVGIGAYAGGSIGADVAPDFPRATSNPEAYKSSLRGVFLKGEASLSAIGGLGLDYQKELTPDPYGYGGDGVSESSPIARVKAKGRFGMKASASGGLEARTGFTVREALGAIGRTLSGSTQVKNNSDGSSTITNTPTGTRISNKATCSSDSEGKTTCN